MNTKDIYFLGAAAWLLSEKARSLPAFNRQLKAIREARPELDALASAGELARAFCHAREVANNWVSEIASGAKGKVQHADKDALMQFAQSAKYLENWLTVIFEVSEDKYARLDASIAEAVSKAKTGQAYPGLLAWVLEQEARGVEAISVTTLKNKIMQTDNAL